MHSLWHIFYIIQWNVSFIYAFIKHFFAHMVANGPPCVSYPAPTMSKTGLSAIVTSCLSLLSSLGLFHTSVNTIYHEKKLYIKMNKIHNLKNCIMFYTIEHYSVMCIVPCVSPEMRMRKVYITNLKDNATGEKFLSQKGFSFSGQGFFQSVKYSLNYFHILQRFTSFQKEKILTAQDFRH